MTVREVTGDSQLIWDKVVNHPLQSWAWGDFRRYQGIRVVRLGVYEKNKLIDGYQLTLHPLPLSKMTIGYFPKGPGINSLMVKALSELAAKYQTVFIQIEPNVIRSSGLKAFSFKNLLVSQHPLFTKYTFILDLTKSEEELMRQMHPKTRYNLRLAQKHQVKIQEDNSDAAFSQYLKLTGETTARQKFYAHNENYHLHMWEILKKAGIAHLFTAAYQNEILAAWIVFVFKDTVYYPYGASSRQYREVMAPNLLLWEIARWAKAKGIKYFDLWGAMGPEPDTNDPFFGFHRFKLGYGPKHVEFVGSYDLIFRPVIYRIYCIADNLRWFILKLNKQLFS